MELDLKGKRALVTGGSKGIGWACANALADEGCEVLIAARNPPAASRHKFRADGIRVVGINPGPVATDRLKNRA